MSLLRLRRSRLTKALFFFLALALLPRPALGAIVPITPGIDSRDIIVDLTGSPVGTVGNPLFTSVTGAGSGGTSSVDEAPFTAGLSGFTPTGGAFNDSAAALTSGQMGLSRSTPNRALHVNLRNQAGTEIGTAGAALRIDPTGATTQPVSAASLPLPTGASTETTLAAVSGKLPAALVGGRLSVDGSGVTQPVSGTVTANAGTGVFVHAGNLTHNNAVPTTNNLGVLGAVANAAAPTYTEGNQTLLSTNLSGAVRAAAEGPTAAGAAVTRPPVLIAGQNGGNVKILGLDASGFFTGNQGTAGTGGASGWFVQGQNASGAAISGNPVQTGGGAVAMGANPTTVSAGQAVGAIYTRGGLPFVIGGHPNIITVRANYTTAQTNVVVVANTAGTKLIVTGFSVTCSNANSVNVAALMGLAQTTTPTTTGVFCAHPGIAPGSGLARGNGGSILAVGADGDQVIANIGVSTGGSTDICVTYYTTAS